MIGLRGIASSWVLLVASTLCAQSPRPLAEATQQVLDRLARAEVAREDGKRGQQFEVVREELREKFRAVISQIREIEKELAVLLRRAYRQKPSELGEKDWTVRELESLARNLKVQLARAYRNQALCYAAGSPDYVNALSLALKQLPNVVSQPLDEASVWQARVEQVVCLRLLKKHDEAKQQIERWQKLSPPKEIAARLANELRTLEIESGNLTSALDQHYPKLLNYAAARLYSTGKLDESVTVYDRIAALHAARRDAERRFQARKTAAAIVREMKRPEMALVRFRELALQDPRHGEDASVHLVAVGLAVELARGAKLEERRQAFDLYRTLLEEHLQHWPKAASAKKVEQWLARTENPEIERERVQTLATHGDRQQALTLYRKLVADSPEDARLLEAYAKLLAAGTEPTELREALRQWHRLETKSKPGGQRWWRGRRARLELLEQLGEGGQAKKLRQLTEILYAEKPGEPRP
jgi:tetratricopeptide (TPR) repeat protein